MSRAGGICLCKVKPDAAVMDAIFTEKPRGDAFVLFGRFDDGFRQRERVSDHSAVQSVLGHDGRTAPAFLRLAPLGPPVLEPHLQSNPIKIVILNLI